MIEPVPGLALVLLAVYGAVALVGRMLLQLLRTGSTGFKVASGAHGRLELLGGLFFVGGIGLAVAGPVFDVQDRLEPLAALDRDVARAAGVGLALGGMVTTVAAQLAMGEAWRIGVDESERTELMTRGPFAVVRNPIYAGMIPFFAGIALLVPSVVTLAGAVLVFFGLEIQTRLVEEPHLLRVHGDAYAEYAARVGRFLPGIGRLRAR